MKVLSTTSVGSYLLALINKEYENNRSRFRTGRTEDRQE